MKKIGFLVLAVVLAIGTLGVGYASWTDTIEIDGTVNTGSVDVDVVYFSGTTIYKDLTTDDMVLYFWVKDFAGNLEFEMYSPTPVGTLFEVASARTTPKEGYTDPDDDKITITFTNAFPCNYLMADFIVHYDGSVPAHLTADFDSYDPMLEYLWDNDYVHIYACSIGVTDIEIGDIIDDIEQTEEVFDITWGDEVVLPFQMHHCEYAKVMLWIDLPQRDEMDGLPNLPDGVPNAGLPPTQEDFMGKTWSFTAHIDATQWNETPINGGG
jgi:hypothetical protein